MLYLYQSNHLELLARLLAAQVAADPLPPLVTERVVVPHPGLGRWLSLQLAESNGFCGDISFVQPAGFMWQILGRLLESGREENRFDPEVLTWAILARLPYFLKDPSFAPVQRYLQGGDPRKQLQFAQRLARAFDRYLVFRPDWITAWEAGELPPGLGEHPDALWQQRLWQALAGKSPHHWVALGRHLQAALREGRVAALEGRVSLFAVGNLSPGYLDMVALLAERLDLHLYLLNPSQVHWSEQVTEWERERREIAANGSELYLEVGNPLLSSLCKQGQQLFAAVAELAPADGAELFVEPSPTTLLGRLQGELLRGEDGRATPLPASAFDPHDDLSLQIHSCHGAVREIEVLYDQLLNLFAHDPELTPDQVLVMTPDLDRYAPIFAGVFGEAGDRPAIPFSLADRGVSNETPLVEGFFALFDLPAQRYPLDRVIALLQIPALARRFGLAESELPECIGWLQQAGIRWGRDGAQRAELGLPAEERNSWRLGLRRLLLGYAMEPGAAGELRLFADTLPLAAALGGAAERLGGVIEAVETLFALESEIVGERKPEAWVVLLEGLLERLFAPAAEEEEAVQTLRDALHRWHQLTRLGGFERPTPLALLLPQLRELVEGSDSNRRFLTGGVTLCGLTSHRILPFAVICLVGMNDGTFPRDHHPEGFDLLAGRWRRGDRSTRLEDRYLFLETLISARRVLYISYSGQDQRDNSSRSPSVVVSELLDYLDACYPPQPGPPKGLSLRQRLLLHHPLQPFSLRYFCDPDSRLLSYSPSLRQAALAAIQSPRQIPRPLCPQPLPEPSPLEEWLTLDLEQLCRFFTNPLRGFCRQRLGLRLEQAVAEPEPREPMAVDRFIGHDLDRILLESARHGESGVQAKALALATQQLPHGTWGEVLITQQQQRAFAFAERLKELDWGEPVPPLTLPELRPTALEPLRLLATLSGLYRDGAMQHHVRPPWDGELLSLWIRHLALQRSSATGRESRWLHPEGELYFPPLDRTTAEAHLTTFCTLYRQGLCQPLPLLPKLSRLFAESERKAKTPELGLEQGLRRVRSKWQGSDQQPGEFQRHPWYALLYPDGVWPEQPFVTLTRQLWGPLLEALQEEGLRVKF